MSKSSEFEINLDEYKSLCKSASLNEDNFVHVDLDQSSLEDEKSLDIAAPSEEEVHFFIEIISKVILQDGPDAFVEFVTANKDRIDMACCFSEELRQTLITCYKLGVSKKSGAYANNLGAMYYSGEFVEQDYEKAKELYELGAEWGNVRAAVNLGYIYEYGRIGEPDYKKAFECYSMAAAIYEDFEALYKMGDMFSRGKVFDRDMKKAYELWNKSYKVAQGAEEESQAAIRLAPLFLDAKSTELGIEPDALVALHLYQIAEIGLRISIDNGLDYYKKRLEQAIEGQAKAREALDNGDFIRYCRD